VLGGLIQDTFSLSRSKVPLLGDIPWLGALFRSESRERKRTNLMVFLRPIVMRDAESANKFSTDRYEQMRSQQKDNQPMPSTMMPINEAPVLPQRPQGREPLAPPPAPSTEGAQPKAPS
jgi:general secretion pathway protein D